MVSYMRRGVEGIFHFTYLFGVEIHHNETSKKCCYLCVFLLKRALWELILLTSEQVKLGSKPQAGLLMVARHDLARLCYAVLKACSVGLGLLWQSLNAYLMLMLVCWSPAGKAMIPK